jgi:hypothetical protein
VSKQQQPAQRAASRVCGGPSAGTPGGAGAGWGRGTKVARRDTYLGTSFLQIPLLQPPTPQVCELSSPPSKQPPPPPLPGVSLGAGSGLSERQDMDNRQGTAMSDPATEAMSQAFVEKAERGDVKAQACLGRFFVEMAEGREGDGEDEGGTARNWARAALWYRHATDGGDAGGRVLHSGPLNTSWFVRPKVSTVA